MTDRVQTRVFCSRTSGAHTVGRVIATSSGPELVIQTAVYGSALGVEQRFRGDDEKARGRHTAWCTACRMELPFTPAAVLDTSGVVVLEAIGMEIDPLGVLDRKAERG